MSIYSYIKHQVSRTPKYSRQSQVLSLTSPRREPKPQTPSINIEATEYSLWSANPFHPMLCIPTQNRSSLPYAERPVGISRTPRARAADKMPRERRFIVKS